MIRALTFLVIFVLFNVGCWSVIKLLRRPVPTVFGAEFSKTARRFERRYVVFAVLTLTGCCLWALIDTFWDLVGQAPF